MAGDDERAVSVPVIYVDAAEVHTFPHTVQILLGSHSPVGVAPRLQIAMSPGFAIELAETLRAALSEYAAHPVPGASTEGDDR